MTTNTDTDAEIEAFLRAFEEGTWPRAEWTHARHLIMALWYVRRDGAREAAGWIRNGIQRYNARQGNSTGYHETITLAWIAVIERFLSTRDQTRPISELARELLAECGDKDHLSRFYTRERLFSEEARARWVAPDRARLEEPNGS